MAKQVTLYDNEYNKLIRFKNVYLDAVKSHTIIELPDNTTIRLFDDLENVIVRGTQITLFYKNYYIVCH
jgi:hypothetical protein